MILIDYKMTKVSLDQCLLGQTFSWTNVPWTKVSLDNCPLDICPLGPRYSWTTAPWTNVATLKIFEAKFKMAAIVQS